MFKQRVLKKYKIKADEIKSLSQLKEQIPKMLKAAQKEYDEWHQDEEGYDHEVGHGGICHLIVDAICDVLDGFERASYSLDSEVHVVTIVQLKEGIFEIDIPYSIYEKGGGYTWKKIPNVVFEKEDIVISKISSDPDDIKNYIEPYID